MNNLNLGDDLNTIGAVVCEANVIQNAVHADIWV